MSTSSPVVHIDPVGVVESCLNSMFVGVFHDEGARQHFGFSRISPFHCDQGVPGWYLWFEGKAGAYAMRITDAVCEPGAASAKASNATVAARIAVTYFPDPEEEIFESFSWFEKIARVSHLFDNSGTPTVDARRQLNDSFFTAGHIDILMTSDGSLLELAFTAAEVWVDIRPTGLVLSDDQGRPFQAVKPGGRDRAVPGWSLLRFLLDKIVCGFLFCQHSGPEQISAYRFSMPEFLVADDNRIEEKFDCNLSGYGLHLAIAPSHESDAITCRAEEMADWQDRLTGTRYPLRSQWEIVWCSRTPQTSDWGCSHWWEVSGHHFEDHHDHLCRCYMDQ